MLMHDVCLVSMRTYIRDVKLYTYTISIHVLALILICSNTHSHPYTHACFSGFWSIYMHVLVVFCVYIYIYIYIYCICLHTDVDARTHVLLAHVNCLCILSLVAIFDHTYLLVFVCIFVRSSCIFVTCPHNTLLCYHSSASSKPSLPQHTFSCKSGLILQMFVVLKDDMILCSRIIIASVTELVRNTFIRLVGHLHLTCSRFSCEPKGFLSPRLL
jgi:hypothetical protein